MYIYIYVYVYVYVHIYVYVQVIEMNEAVAKPAQTQSKNAESTMFWKPKHQFLLYGTCLSHIQVHQH